MPNNFEDKVILTESEYMRLRIAEDKLDALIANGVDNWVGYDLAMEDYTGGEDDDI